jgi:hypothetical protein
VPVGDELAKGLSRCLLALGHACCAVPEDSGRLAPPVEGQALDDTPRVAPGRGRGRAADRDEGVERAPAVRECRPSRPAQHSPGAAPAGAGRVVQSHRLERERATPWGEARVDWTADVSPLLDRDQDIAAAEAVERRQRAAGHAAARPPLVARAVAANGENLAGIDQLRGEVASGAVPPGRERQRAPPSRMAIHRDVIPPCYAHQRAGGPCACGAQAARPFVTSQLLHHTPRRLPPGRRTASRNNASLDVSGERRSSAPRNGALAGRRFRCLA